MIKWLAARGRPVEDMLRRSGIGYVWLEDPYVPVPTRAVEAFVIEASRLEGPDFGCKVLTQDSLRDIAAIGLIGLSARTPREGLAKICHAMPFHSSHQILSVAARSQESLIQEYWTVTLNPEAHHIFQQFVAGLIQLLIQAARPDGPAFNRMEIIPHPDHGLDHLTRWFQAEILPAPRPLMVLSVANTRLDASMPSSRPGRAFPGKGFAWQRLREGSMAGSARHVIRAMLRDGAPTIERLSVLADMSIRTLQRRLAAEGVSFSDLVEQVRRDAAMAALSGSDAAIGDVSANLGYSKQSSLTRAVRRWTGRPPAALRHDRDARAEG
jgi:AraC-like DNA-binding protein